METTFAAKYAQFTHSLDFQAIPHEVIVHAKQLILDTLGICIASSRQETAEIFPSLVLEMGGRQESTVIGQKEKVPAANAALVNGTFAHYLDYDDSHLKSGGHVSATIVPTALSLAEAHSLDGKVLLEAVVAGWECITRIGMTYPTNFHDKGFHCTGIVGPFGAAIVSGKILGIETDKLVSALGIAGSQAAALMECRYDGSIVKRMHPGWSAHSGIIATKLAQRGFTGPRSVFEGKFGLYLSHLGPGNYDPANLDSLGQEWETLNCLIKPYPCSHYLHAYMDAAKELRHQEHLDPADIASIELLVNDTGAKLTCEAPSVQPPPETAYVAQFSLRYAVALSLLQDKITLADFREPKIMDPVVTALGQKITHTVTPELSFGAGAYYSGWLKVKLRDGRILEYLQRYNRGSRENPLTSQDVEEKFYDNASSVLPMENCRRIAALVSNLENLDDLSLLTKELRY